MLYGRRGIQRMLCSFNNEIPKNNPNNPWERCSAWVENLRDMVTAERLMCGSIICWWHRWCWSFTVNKNIGHVFILQNFEGKLIAEINDAPEQRIVSRVTVCTSLPSIPGSFPLIWTCWTLCFVVSPLQALLHLQETGLSLYRCAEAY